MGGFTLPSLLEKIYPASVRHRKEPTKKELVALIYECASTFQNIFLVFDALDECFAGTREALLNFISEFNRTTQRIMITSRLDEPIWRENLNDATVVCIESDLKDL